MPELPEVETVRRALEANILGREVIRVQAAPIRLRRPIDPVRLESGLVGAQLTGCARRGKFLLIETSTGGTVLAHLGMSGRITVCPPGASLQSHTHVVLTLEGDLELRFRDPRRFGLFEWKAPGTSDLDPSIAGLGPEPFDPGLDDVLPHRLRAHRAPIKSMLLDQRLVAGVGNIYATEALWRAGIRPSRPSSSISLGRLRALVGHLRVILEEAIAQGGTTLRDFASPGGGDGLFTVELKAYGREGEPCLRCPGTMRRQVIAGRATAWCPGCQR